MKHTQGERRRFARSAAVRPVTARAALKEGAAKGIEAKARIADLLEVPIPCVERLWAKTGRPTLGSPPSPHFRPHAST